MAMTVSPPLILHSGSTLERCSELEVQDQCIVKTKQQAITQNYWIFQVGRLRNFLGEIGSDLSDTITIFYMEHTLREMLAG